MTLRAKVTIARPAPLPQLRAPVILQGRGDGSPVIFATFVNEPKGLFDGVILYDSDDIGRTGYYGAGFYLSAYEPFRGSITLTNEGQS